MNNDFFPTSFDIFSKKNCEKFGNLCFLISKLTKIAKILGNFFKILISQNGLKNPNGETILEM